MEPKAASRPLTFRVENIPPDTTAEELIKYFHTEDQPHIRVRSIVPAVDSYKLDMQEYTATISFQSVDPRILAPRLVDEDLSIDCDFHGFTPLNHPQEPIAADIIAVTGLAAHAFGSWAHSANNMWLRDYLPRDVSNARVLIYGYPLQLHGNVSRSILSDHSSKMINRLLTMREAAKCQDRPIIFIGHSLGCLIIKKVLCDINGSVGIYSSRLPVCSIIFLGAPHRGLETTALESLVKSQATEDIVRELKAGSPTLTELNDKFRHVAKAIDILTCYELSPTKTAIEVVYDHTDQPVATNGLQMPNGTWKREGPPMIMVSLDSARQWYPREECVACHADHTQIAKLKRGENGIYPSVWWAIKKALLSAGDLASEAKSAPCGEDSHLGSVDEASKLHLSVSKVADRQNSTLIDGHPANPALLPSKLLSEDVIGQQIRRLQQAELNQSTYIEDSWSERDSFSGIADQWHSGKDTRKEDDDRSSAGPSKPVEKDITLVNHDEDGTRTEKSKLEMWLDTEATAPRPPTAEMVAKSPMIDNKVDTVLTVQTKKKDITRGGAKSKIMDKVMSSAIIEGNEQRTRALLEYIYHIECKDKDGETPLLLATRHRREALVRMLLEQGANPSERNNKDSTVLHMLAVRSETPISESLVTLVLKSGLSLNAQNEFGITPLMLACASGEHLLVSRLIHDGADVRAADHDGLTPLHYLAYHKQAKATPLARTKESEENRTPLHRAISSVISSILKELILAGGDKEARTLSGRHTPLLLAVREGNEAYVTCLMESGININASNIKNKTSLHIAAARGKLRIVKALLEHGANPTIKAGVFLGERASVVSMRSGVSPTQKKAIRKLLEEAEKAWKQSHREKEQS